METRFARPDDYPAILAIYAQYIKTPVTFEYTLPTEHEFSKRIAGISKNYPCLVCEENNIVVGYAYAHRHMEREAYQWSAELSVYIDQRFMARGLGKKLYRALIEILKLQGIRTVYGGVTSPNESSEALHKALGFTVLGVYHNAGYKNGKWHDVAWFEKQIGPYDDNPLPVRPVTDIPEDQLQALMSS